MGSEHDGSALAMKVLNALGFGVLVNWLTLMVGHEQEYKFMLSANDDV